MRKFMRSINNVPRIKLSISKKGASLSFFFTISLSSERFACYNSYQCSASERKLEGVRFLSVGGFIIATGGAVGNRVDKFVAVEAFVARQRWTPYRRRISSFSIYVIMSDTASIITTRYRSTATIPVSNLTIYFRDVICARIHV